MSHQDTKDTKASVGAMSLRRMEQVGGLFARRITKCVIDEVDRAGNSPTRLLEVVTVVATTLVWKAVYLLRESGVADPAALVAEMAREAAKELPADGAEGRDR